MPLSLAVFLERVLHCDFLVHHDSAMHILDCAVGVVEGGKGNKAIAFAEVVLISGNL